MARISDTDFESLITSRAFVDLSLIINEMTGLNISVYPRDSLRQARLSETNANACCAWLRQRRWGLEKCHRCEEKRFARVCAEKHEVVEICHAGFLDIAIPVLHQGEVVAIMSTGQMLPEPHSGEGYERLKAILAAAGVPERVLRESYSTLPYLPQNRLAAVMKLLSFFATYMVDMQQRFTSLVSGENPAVAYVRRYISEHPDSDLSLQELSRLSGYSRWHLCRAFQRETGETLTSFIQRTRIERARHLLSNTSLPVTTIALMAGFSSISHFNRTFRSLQGCSPTAFRKELDPPCGSSDADAGLQQA